MKNPFKDLFDPKKQKQPFVEINPNVHRIGGTAYIDPEVADEKISELNEFLNKLADEHGVDREGISE